VRKTHRAVVVEDDWRFGGFAGEISALIMEQAFDELDAPVARVCGADVPMPYAKQLEQAALPQPQDIADAALGLF
jgi:pyruvate dehydrogenase E1 component beta subunit